MGQRYKGIAVALAVGLLLSGANTSISKNGAVAAENPPIAPHESIPGVTDHEVLIGSCCPLDGSIAFIGQQQIVGARMYLDHINEQGGVNGRKIKLTTYNDHYEGDKTYECWGRFTRDGAFAGAFFVGTAAASKYVPMAENSHVPVVGLFTGAQFLHEPFRPHIYSVRASFNDEVKEQIDHLWNQTGSHKIGVIYADDVLGQSMLSSLRKSLERYHSAPVAIGSYRRNSSDVDGAIKEVAAAEPDAVVLVGSYPSLAAIVKRAHAMNWHPLFTSLSFVGTEPFIKAAGNDAEGMVITQVVPSYASDLPLAQQYRKLLKKHPDQKPSYPGFEGFVDAYVLVEALKHAGRDLTRAKLMSALDGMHDLDIGLGTKQKLSFGPNDHKGFDAVHVTVVHDGKPMPLNDWKQLHIKH